MLEESPPTGLPEDKVKVSVAFSRANLLQSPVFIKLLAFNSEALSPRVLTWELE